MSRRFLAALAVCLLWTPAFGAERFGRFTLDVRIEGAGQQAKGGEQSRLRSDETLHMAFTLASPGVTEADNRLEETGTNLAAMQKAAVTLARQGGRAVGPARAGRYLTYSATAESNCQPEFRARLRNMIEGLAPGVNGMTPFAQTSNADFKATPVQLTPLCTALVVVDTGNNTIFVYPPLIPVRGKVLRMEGKRTTIDAATSTVRLSQPALDWVVRQLQGAPASGTQRTSLTVPNAAGETGTTVLQVDMRWRFDGK